MHMRSAEALRRGPVVQGAEQGHAAIGLVVGFHAFKNGLAIMQRRVSRTHRNIAVRQNLGVLPLAVAVVHHEHVVSENFAEFEVLEVLRGQPRGHSWLRANRKSVYHKKAITGYAWVGFSEYGMGERGGN